MTESLPQGKRSHNSQLGQSHPEAGLALAVLYTMTVANSAFLGPNLLTGSKIYQSGPHVHFPAWEGKVEALYRNAGPVIRTRNQGSNMGRLYWEAAYSTSFADSVGTMELLLCEHFPQ